MHRRERQQKPNDNIMKETTRNLVLIISGLIVYALLLIKAWMTEYF